MAVVGRAVAGELLQVRRRAWRGRSVLPVSRRRRRAGRRPVPSRPAAARSRPERAPRRGSGIAMSTASGHSARCARRALSRSLSGAYGAVVAGEVEVLQVDQRVAAVQLRARRSRTRAARLERRQVRLVVRVVERRATEPAQCTGSRPRARGPGSGRRTRGVRPPRGGRERCRSSTRAQVGGGGVHGGERTSRAGRRSGASGTACSGSPAGRPDVPHGTATGFTLPPLR